MDIKQVGHALIISAGAKQRANRPSTRIALRPCGEFYLVVKCAAGGGDYLVVISNCGGCCKCFFTAHNSTALIIAPRYFSGKPLGSSISKSTFSTMPVLG